MEQDRLGAEEQFQTRIDHWLCEARVRRSSTQTALDLTCRHAARRQARVGEPLVLRAWGYVRGGRLIIRYGVWVLWDTAEHQRLRWGEDTLVVPHDLAPWLSHLGVPHDAASQLAQQLAGWLGHRSPV